MSDVVDKIDDYIDKYNRLSVLAYERAWFKDYEQYLLVVRVLTSLKEDVELL